jgi:hypothetical protein
LGERYDPWEHSANLGLRVIRRDLRKPHRALWHPPSRTVILDRGLSQRERRCSLAHELVHVERGDECRQAPRVEVAVHAVAARRLIVMAALIEGMRWTRDFHVLADELWVDAPTLECRLEHLTNCERELLEQAVAA